MSTLSPVSHIIEKLKSNGHRITAVRRALLDFFAKNGRPASAPEILSHLENNRLRVNKTTVYRELLFLKKNGIVTEIQFRDGMMRYELAQKDG
ncbi:MAG: transcriptional repressor, partial [Patescibacteria group bacterium]